MTPALSKRTQTIVQALDEKKAQYITIFDVESSEYITDSVVIATALAGKHSHALLDHLKSTCKPMGEVFYHVDEESEDWIIADLGEIMVHIFTEHTRARFNLEEFLQEHFCKSHQESHNTKSKDTSTQASTKVSRA